MQGPVICVYRNSAQRSSLKVAGSLKKVLQATLGMDDVLDRHFIDTEYSIGLGALGPSTDESRLLLGEMITIGGNHGMAAYGRP